MAPKTGKAKPHKAKGEKKKKEEKGLGSFMVLLLLFCLVAEKLDFEKKKKACNSYIYIPRYEQFCLYNTCFHLVRQESFHIFLATNNTASSCQSIYVFVAYDSHFIIVSCRFSSIFLATKRNLIFNFIVL